MGTLIQEYSMCFWNVEGRMTKSTEKLWGKSSKEGNFKTVSWINAHLQSNKRQSRQKCRAWKARYVQRIEAYGDVYGLLKLLIKAFL